MKRMTNAYTGTRIYETDHTEFGGFIYLSDFNTNHRVKNNFKGSPITKRIMKDMQFDRQCKKSAHAADAIGKKV